MSEPRGLWTIKPSEHAHLVGRAEKAEAERDAYRAALADLTGELNSLIARGVIGQGWAAGHLPKYYAARAVLAGDHDQGAQQ